MREKTGGRKAGIKNRSKLEKIDIFKKMEEILNLPDITSELKFEILRTMALYKHRKISING